MAHAGVGASILLVAAEDLVAALPAEKRQGIRALYALCRTSDDLVDGASENPHRSLAHWVAHVHAPVPPTMEFIRGSGLGAQTK